MSSQNPFDFDDLPEPPPQQPYYGPPPTDPFGNPVSPYSGSVPPPAPQTDPFGNPITPYGRAPTPPPPRSGFPTCLVLFIIAFACCLPLGIVGAVLATTAGAFGQISDLSDIGSIFENIGDTVNQVAESLQGPPTEAIDGDPANFDPLVGLDQAQAFAGNGAALAALTARYIRSDGTMDLTADYNAATTYEFVRPVDPPADAPPVGTSNNRGGQWYEPITIEAYRPGQVSTITSTGGGVSTRITFVNQGLRKDVDDPTTNPFNLPAPPLTCDFAALWAEAIDQGAPEDAVAIIEYDSFGDEWEYTFSISGWQFLTFDENCKQT